MRTKPGRIWVRLGESGTGLHRPLKNRYLFLEDSSQPFFLGFQIVPKLEVEPEAFTGPKETRESQRSVGRDATFTMDDLVDASGRHADFLCQTILAEFEWVQKLLQ
jgi:hypothetical protein